MKIILTVFLIAILAKLGQKLMEKDFTTMRLELWQIISEFLAMFGVESNVIWYQFRHNRYYIVMQINGRSVSNKRMAY